MDRRQFLKAGLIAGVTTAASRGSWPSDMSSAGACGVWSNVAPRVGTFRFHAGPDPVDQIAFASERGFTVFEVLDLRHRSPFQQERLGRELNRRRMAVGRFEGLVDFDRPTFASSQAVERARMLPNIQQAIVLAHRSHSRCFSVVPGLQDDRIALSRQRDNAIDMLRRCAELCESAGVTMLLESLERGPGTPRLLLQDAGEAAVLCRAVGSPACRVLFSVHHQAARGRDWLARLEAMWDVIGQIDFADWPGGKEPGTGSLDCRRLFALLRGRGYDGLVGMAHGSSQAGRDGELAVLEAYARHASV